MITLGGVHAVDAAGRRVHVGRLTGQRVWRSVRRILGATRLCSMATVAGAGRAHINTAYFAFSDDLELVFLSHPRSQHSRNLARRPSLAMTVFSSNQRWTDPGRGLQLFGRCRPARGRQARTALRLYARRFPSLAAWTRTLEEAGVGRDYRLYWFLPARLKIHDEREFGDGVFVRAALER